VLLQDYLINSSQRHPHKDALFFGGRSVDYHTLAGAAHSIAQWILQFKPTAGFRVGILTDDPLEYSAGYFGILMAGGVVVGLNTQTSDRSLLYTLDDSGANFLIAGKKFLPYIKRIAPSLQAVKAVAVTDGAAPARQGKILWENLTTLLGEPPSGETIPPYRSCCDLAQIIYTSGTTGKPKGVMLRHANLIANTESILQYLHITASDRIMAVLPFFYSYGNSILLTHVAAGASLVVNQNFIYPNVILDQMVEYEVTGFSGVPSTFAILLNRSAIDNYSFPKLRYLTQAGAAMSPALARRLGKVFPGAEIFIMYGQTEASARLAYLSPGDLGTKPGSIGKAIPGVELLLLDKEGKKVAPGEIGEIVARGDNIMSGYWNREEETRKVLRPEGLWTGDLARKDEDGYLYIVSRKSDIIKSGSHRIGPKEIEDVLMEHPAIHEAAVVGDADELLGETIRGCIVLQDGVEINTREIIKHCRKRLPAYKVPHRIEIMDNLPKTATGKIRKADLRLPN